MIFHFKKKDSKDDSIEKFEMDDDFFIQFENFFEDIYKRPSIGKSIGTINYSVPMLSGIELNNLIKKMKNDAGFDYFEPKVAAEEQTDFVVENPKAPIWEVYSPTNILNEIKSRFKL